MHVSSTKAEILEEMKKLQFFYGLKNEVRFGETRNEPHNPESVAEHIYGMHVMCEYFLPLEDPEKELDVQKMRTLITFHDIDEIVTGDVVGYLKTKEDAVREEEASMTVLRSIPDSMKQTVSDALKEYKEGSTPEAKFVKALDKIEPVVHVFNSKGKELLNRMKTTRAQHDSIKKPYFKDFPIIDRLYSIVTDEMDTNGFFVKE